jgi:hypothetical protein
MDRSSNALSSTTSTKFKLYEIYPIEPSKYMRIKILTVVMKQKNKMWIGRTELPL